MSNTLNKPTDNQPTKPSNSSSPPSSSTSTKSKKTVQVIVGEIGRDSKTGILGRGYSYDNGKTFHVLDTMYGRLYGDDDIEAIWINGVSNRVKSEVNSATAEIPAIESKANESLKKADSAIASSKVNSDAIIAQSEAISEAKSAMDSATAEIQQTASNAASDAAKIRADVAQVQNEVDTAKAANSASVEALKSDIDTAKQDLANVHDSLTKAQSAVEQNQKLINDSVAKISNDIAQDRKDIASAQQNNADLAKQLDDYSKQAEAQGKTIKSIQDKQDSFTATLADVQGNVSQVSDKVDGLSASLKDTQGNVATVKVQADQLNATLTDHAKSIATLTASAKELSSTLEDADGRLSKVEQTAQTNSSTLSDVQGDLSQVKQDASTLTATLKDAQGNISTLQQKADSVSAQLASAQGDIASLQTDVTGIKATLVSHEGDIHTLQADSKSLHDSMQDAQGDISTLKKTSTDVTSELKDHAGRISKAEQTASTLVNEFADQQGHLNRVEQTAQGTQQTVANQQGQINTIKTDAAGIHETLTGQGNQITNINVTLSGLNSKYDGVSGDLSKLSDKVTTNSTQIDQDKKLIALKADQSTVNNLSGEVSQNSAQLKVQADQISSKVSSADFKTLNDKVNSDTGGGVNLLANSKGPFRPTGVATTAAADNYAIYSGSTIYMVQGQIYTISGQTNGVWSGNHDPNTVSDKCVVWLVNNQQSIIISANTMPHTFTWNYPTGTRELRVNAYHKGAGNTIYAEKIKIERGSTATPWTPAPEDTITAIQKNSTAIDQNNKQISLKADQTEVDKIKETASYNSSRLDVMNNEIKSKVSSADVNDIVDSKGYATTSTVQSLVDQKAGTINESITNLTTELKNNNGGGINLQKGTKDCSFQIGTNGNPSSIETYNSDTKMIHTQNGGFYTSYSDSSFVPTPGEFYTISADVKGDGAINGSGFRYEGGNNGTMGNVTLSDTWQRIINTVHVDRVQGQWVIYPSNSKNLYVKHIKIERGSVATPWTPAPSDNATVTQFQQITATLDGLQSTVANKADTSQITQLSNLIQSKVSSNDFTSKISQLLNDINARVSKGDLITQINLEAGRALFQSKKIYMDADTVVMGPHTRAFIPSAAITSLEADKITTGTLNGVHIHQIANANGRSIDIANGNISLNSSDPYESRISFTNNGKDAKMFNAVGDIEVLNQEFALFNFTPEDTHSLNPIPFFKVTNTGQIGSGGAQLNMDHAIFDGYEWWTPSAGVTFGRTWNGVDKSSDYADIYAKSFVPHSELSAKTRIKKLDRKEALDKIMQDDMYTYQFKEDVRDGVSKRYASFIIDNIHDVAQYTEPEEFLSANGKGRDDGTQLAYLIAAVQYQQEQIEELKKKLEEK